jgi:hypothetical protein
VASAFAGSPAEPVGAAAPGPYTVTCTSRATRHTRSQSPAMGPGANAATTHTAGRIPHPCLLQLVFTTLTGAGCPMDTHPELAIIQVDIAQPHPQQLGGACPGTDVASQQCPARGAAHLGQSSSRCGSGIARDCRAAPSAVACPPALPGSLHMPGRRAPDPAPLGARSSQCPAAYRPITLRCWPTPPAWAAIVQTTC